LPVEKGRSIVYPWNFKGKSNMAKKGKYVYEWPRPMVTVDAAVFSTGGPKPQVLLIKRAREPNKGLWAFPGGFLEIDEELIDGAARELNEETGLTGIELKQMHTFGTIGRDPRGRIITVVYTGAIKQPREVSAGDDAEEAKWFDIDELPEMAFDHEVVAKAAIAHGFGEK
jgi:8-oxo-dGTP diphosphatase